MRNNNFQSQVENFYFNTSIKGSCVEWNKCRNKQKELVQIYGVSPAVVSQIISRKWWKHVR